MSNSFEDRQRRRGIYAFLGAYLAFMATLVVLEVARNHDLGYGFF